MALAARTGNKWASNLRRSWVARFEPDKRLEERTGECLRTDDGVSLYGIGAMIASLLLIWRAVRGVAERRHDAGILHRWARHACRSCGRFGWKPWDWG